MAPPPGQISKVLSKSIFLQFCHEPHWLFVSRYFIYHRRLPSETVYKKSLPRSTFSHYSTCNLINVAEEQKKFLICIHHAKYRNNCISCMLEYGFIFGPRWNEVLCTAFADLPTWLFAKKVIFNVDVDICAFCDASVAVNEIRTALKWTAWIVTTYSSPVLLFNKIQQLKRLIFPLLYL